MAVTFIKRTSIPVPIKGKLATDPQVSISESGQMTLSTLAVKLLGGKECKKVGVGYDKESRLLMIFPQGHKSIAKMPDAELWDLKHSKKGNSATLSGSASFLNNEGVFGNEKYNYKESGGQILPVVEKGGAITYTIPKGILERRKVIVRKRKEKVQPITSAPAPAAVTPQPPKTDDILVELESA